MAENVRVSGNALAAQIESMLPRMKSFGGFDTGIFLPMTERERKRFDARMAREQEREYQEALWWEQAGFPEITVQA